MKKFASIFKKLGFTALSVGADSLPIGGVVKAVLKKVLNLDEGANVEEELDLALAGSDPEVLLKLREADSKLKIKLEKAGIDIYKLEIEDRASARAREIATRDNTPKVLAYGTIVGFFAILGALIWMGAGGTELPEGVGTIVKVLMGTLGGMLLQQQNYFFGSTQGSARKTEIIAKNGSGH